MKQKNSLNRWFYKLIANTWPAHWMPHKFIEKNGKLIIIILFIRPMLSSDKNIKYRFFNSIWSVKIAMNLHIKKTPIYTKLCKRWTFILRNQRVLNVVLRSLWYFANDYLLQVIALSRTHAIQCKMSLL